MSQAATPFDWLDAIPAAIFLVQGQRVVFANRHAAEMAGCSSTALLMVAPGLLLSGLDTNPLTGWIHPPARSAIPAAFTVAKVDHAGQPAQLVTAVPRVDVTETREMSMPSFPVEIDRQARLLDQILAATPDTFVLFDRSGHYLYVNSSGFQGNGLMPEYVIGKTWRQIGLPEELGLRFEQRIEHVFETGESLTYEEQFPMLDGWQDFLTTLTPIRNGEGTIIYALNTIRDITARKQAEMETSKLAAELEQQARVFDEVLSTTPDNFLMVDRDGCIVYASPSVLQDLRKTSEQVLGLTWRELGFVEDETLFETSMAGVFTSGEAHVIEIHQSTPRGRYEYERVFSPLHDRAGQVVAVVITDHDITERKRIAKALSENQRLFTSIFETALTGIAVLNADGRYMQVNRAYGDIFGYSANELIGEDFTKVYRREDMERARSLHKRLIAGEIIDPIMDWTAVHRDGRQIEITFYNNLLVREDGHRYRVVAVIDVTAQKVAQRALEASEQRLTSILDSMEDVVWSVTAVGHHWVYANSAIEALTGYSASDFSANENLLVDIVHLDDRALFASQLVDILDSARNDIEYRIIRRDGTLRWVHNRFWTVNSADGQRIDGIMSDITDRKQAAEQAMQLSFERERVRILSGFVRDASHEFRTPLAVINTRLYLMEKSNAPERQAEFIEGVREQAERILRLVESLITMSRLDSMAQLEFGWVDLSRVAFKMRRGFEGPAQRKGVGFHIQIEPGAMSVYGDAEELTMAFRELIDNAISFTPPGGEVSARILRLNDVDFALEVRDTGIGITEEEMPHIFERFYRVDSARTTRGFGLGLPIARKIAEMHGGRIDVQSAPGEGSLFQLIIPAERPPAAG